MQLSRVFSQPTIIRPEAKRFEGNHSKSANNEINAYIAIRDSLLAQAEEATTDANLHRACIANDVVEIFLKPARAGYEAQQLPEADAIREREHCEAVKMRIGELACIAVARYDRARSGAR
jgi:hypothetical protein